MITSIFSKSKSINFIIVFFITLLAFIMARVGLVNEPITWMFVLKQIVLLFVSYISILLLNFIVSKNNLTTKNNYEILLFSLFLLLIVHTTSNTNVIFSNFFILLGLRRIMSLRSQKDVTKKLFDAAFWIAIAALFYFWAILFFALILVSLILYTDNNKLGNWIIPFMGIASVFVISISVSVIIYDDFFGIFDITPGISYDFSNYNSVKYLVAITLLLSFGIWSSIFYSQNIKKKKKAFRASFKIIIVMAIIAFLIMLQAPKKNGSEFLFMFAPLTVIISNYIEIIQEKWFKEVFLSLIIIIPFIALLL